MTRPLGRGRRASRAWHQVRGTWELDSTCTARTPSAPAGAEGLGLAQTQRMRLTGGREQGQRPAATPPEQASGRRGPPGRPAVAHVKRGHAACPPAPAARGGNEAVAAGSDLPNDAARPQPRRRPTAGLTSLRTFSNE